MEDNETKNVISLEQYVRPRFDLPSATNMPTYPKGGRDAKPSRNPFAQNSIRKTRQLVLWKPV